MTASTTDRYNRQLHQTEMDLIKEKAKQFAEEMRVTEEEAKAILAQQALRRVDAKWAYALGEDEQYGEAADAFLDRHGDGKFTATEAERNDFYLGYKNIVQPDQSETLDFDEFGVKQAAGSPYENLEFYEKYISPGVTNRTAASFASGIEGSKDFFVNTAEGLVSLYDLVMDGRMDLPTAFELMAEAGYAGFGFEMMGKRTIALLAGDEAEADRIVSEYLTGLGVGAGISKAGAKIEVAKTGSKVCSFHGDTQVLTQTGYQAIRTLKAGIDQVWSRSEHTGAMGWKAIEAHYSNPYPSQVTVTFKDSETGQQQQIISNKIHPYFVQLPEGETETQITPSSEGHDYQGVIARGRWVDAQHLQAGYRLLNADNSWAEVVGVSIIDEPLTAYNLTVADYHTYFVAGAMGAPAVWVHNDCAKLAEQRQAEVSDLFDSSSPVNTLQIGDKNVPLNSSQSRGAKVFNGVSESEVKQFFIELTGNPLPDGVPVKIRGEEGLRYTVSTSQGNFTLRNVSASTGKDGWTIDIPKGITGKSEEIKFLN